MERGDSIGPSSRSHAPAWERGNVDTPMQRPSLHELEHRCQKPDHRRIGNWMARRISRPVALRVTWLVAPWGVSANAATLAAWGCGAAAAAAFACGSVWGWLLGAGLLQTWYLLDHVDGQLARLRGTDSLDGVQFDYLMHHTVNLLVPLGVGFGLFARAAEPLWLLAGLVWGVALLLITLQHDARYKAFVGRLKRVRGLLHVRGGGGARPTPQPPVPRNPLHVVAWAARKTCEAHVMMNLLCALALGQLFLGDKGLLAGRIYVLVMAPLAAAAAAWSIARSQRGQSAEQEFAAWYRVPPGRELVYSQGWWVIQPETGADVRQNGEASESAKDSPEDATQSS
jgi:phosphatidylglycerophosphate synthase